MWVCVCVRACVRACVCVFCLIACLLACFLLIQSFVHFINYGFLLLFCSYLFIIYIKIVVCSQPAITERSQEVYVRHRRCCSWLCTVASRRVSSGRLLRHQVRLLVGWE